MRATRQADRDQALAQPFIAFRQPGGQTFPRGFGDLELYRVSRLLLDDHATALGFETGGHIDEPELCQITTTQRRLNGQIEEGAFPDRATMLEV